MYVFCYAYFTCRVSYVVGVGIQIVKAFMKNVVIKFYISTMKYNFILT